MTEREPARNRTVFSISLGDLRPRGRSELVPRVISAVVMAAAAVATAWIGGPVFTLFWCLAALAVLWEWQGLVAGPRRNPAVAVGGVALAVAAFLAGAGRPVAAMALLGLGAVATAMIGNPGQRRIMAGGPLYAGALAVSLPILRQSTHDGFVIVLWLFAVVWGTDTMAYFGGRLIGGPKLARRLSPSKTWSGFLIGISCGALLGVLVVPARGCGVCILAAGLCGGALAQAGDLFESSMKRRYGVKDAGSLIPGHGGVMDRLDGFIAASLFAAGIGLWRFGPMAAGSGLLQW